MRGLVRSAMLLMITISSAEAQQNSLGVEIYYACATCHGPRGEGNEARHAPALAGQPAWYIAGQLRAFRNGWRGHEKDDFIARQMALFAEVLPSEEALDAIAEYVASLPRQYNGASTGAVDPKSQRLYQSCAVCHGDTGQGNESLAAPPLVGKESWYLRRQLFAFAKGERGTAAGDINGLQMRAAMSNVKDDQDIHSLVTFIATFAE